MKKQLTLTLCIAAATLAVLHPRVASAQCTVDFSDPSALGRVFSGAARDTFAERTIVVQTGIFSYCDLSNDVAWSRCWDYRNRCGTFSATGATAYMNTWPSDYSHYHLNFWNTAFLKGCFCDPHDGYGSGFSLKFADGTCQTTNCPDWTQQPRTMTPHRNDLWVLLYMEQGGDGVKHRFTLQSVTLGKGDPMQLWYTRASDNTSWGWSRLDSPAVGTAEVTHTLNTPEVTEVWLSTTVGFGSQYNLKRYVVTPTR
jgi:hypothetical protein